MHLWRKLGLVLTIEAAFVTLKNSAKLNSRQPKPREGKGLVLRVATELFATHGFHAVSIRDIASACGVGVSTVLYHGGSKQQLLEEIVANSISSQFRISAFLKKLDSSKIKDQQDFLHVYDAFVDALVQDSAESPQTRRLWLRLLLDQPELFTSLEAQYIWPIFAEVFAFLRAARDKGFIKGDDSQIRYFVTSLDWILDGYFAGGVLDYSGKRASATSKKELARLRTFLCDFGRAGLISAACSPKPKTTRQS